MEKMADADLLQALSDQPEEWGQVRISVPPDTGRFLHVLVHMAKPKRILEIGMFHGYSTIWIGLAARAVGARITTLELEAEKVAGRSQFCQGRLVAEANFSKAGLSEVITVIQGDGKQTLATLAGPYDLVFLDAAKEDYAAYFDLIYPRLSPGGVIVADNAVSHGENMAEYFSKVRGHPNCVSVLVPIGTGEEVTYKKG